MYTTNLRKVGGSVMLAVPPAILDVLHLSSGSVVGMAIENGRLLIEPQCDETIEISSEEREWLNATSVGAELL